MTTHDCPTCHMRPGSDTAREAGCICPVMDNGRGHGDPRFQVVFIGCPIHTPDILNGDNA